MTKDEALNKLRELHNSVKEHPYWNIFDHAMFRNEIKPSFWKMMDTVSYIRYKIEGANTDTPFFALHERLFHDFNAVLGRLAYDSKIEESNDFKRYYLVMLQSYLQLVHFFIEGIDDANVLVMYMVDSVYAPHELQKLVPYYHENWVDNEGYKYYSSNKWHVVLEVKEDEAEELIKRYENWEKTTNSDTMRYIYRHHIKDLKERTNFVFKVCS